jgi:ATP-dependent DNA helicase DinG
MIGPVPEAASGDNSALLARKAVAATKVRVAKMFLADGWLQTALKLEHRPGQERMARAVAAALGNDEALIVEAGTGIGKSLAYLLPGLLLAQETKRPLVVSTHTIALQEQIFKKDLEICRTLFRAVPELKPFADFLATVLVGRANYLCPQRLARALQTRADLFERALHDDLERIVDWSLKTSDGLLEELQPPPHYDVWEAVNADSSSCNPKTCSPDTCFFQRARSRVRKAHLVIVNHSLLFSLIHAGAGPETDARGILFPDDFVVLDEAHRVPETATDHFGARLSSFGLDRALHALYHPKTRKGFLARRGSKHDHTLVTTALDAAKLFFENVSEKYLARKPIVRLHEPNWSPPVLDGPLKILSDRLGQLVESAANENEAEELRDHKKKINGFRATLDACLKLAEPDQVYWLERGGKRGQLVHVRAAPLDVAPQLREAIFTRDTGVVLTSATLTDGATLDAFRARVGAPPAAAGRVENSPFDFKKNLRVFIAADAPDPAPGTGRLDLAWLADMVSFCVRRVRGGSLVLFTSHADLRAVAELVEPALTKAHRPFFRQGLDFSRGDLTRHFAQAGNGVLFGTDSFWTGIDVPGAALSQVILTRLPFENPSHPVLEARHERVRGRGGNAFAEITLPDALVKFRQGIGRLIRRQTDCGTVTILDARVLRKEYGKRFIAALPRKGHTVFSRADRDDTFDPLEAPA